MTKTTKRPKASRCSDCKNTGSNRPYFLQHHIASASYLHLPLYIIVYRFMIIQVTSWNRRTIICAFTILGSIHFFLVWIMYGCPLRIDLKFWNFIYRFVTNSIMKLKDNILYIPASKFFSLPLNYTSVMQCTRQRP